jgi:hypothetical protein
VRRHAIIEYKSILELLVKPGCPVCTFLKNEQASLLQKGSDLFGSLCNAHAWGFAAVSDARVAAPALLGCLEQDETLGKKSRDDCGLCSRLRVIEGGAVSELSSSASRAALITWLDDDGAFCAPHSSRLRTNLDPDTASLIDKSDSRKRSELITTLKALISSAGGAAKEQAGTLGRAAEYLVSQRGLPLWQDSHDGNK